MIWVKMLKNYSGPAGFFTEGSRMQLPPETLDAIGQKYYKETCPPWEDQADNDGNELLRLKKEYEHTVEFGVRQIMAADEKTDESAKLSEQAKACRENASLAKGEADKIVEKLDKLTAKIEAKKAKKKKAKKKKAKKKKAKKKKAKKKTTKKVTKKKSVKKAAKKDEAGKNKPAKKAEPAKTDDNTKRQTAAAGAGRKKLSK